MKTCTVCSAEWPDDTKFCPNDGTTLRSASGTADLIDSVIADRYHISKKLGEGGMGAVYLGEHVKMGRKSAIKVMAQSMTNDPEAIARFNREAANKREERAAKSPNPEAKAEARQRQLFQRPTMGNDQAAVLFEETRRLNPSTFGLRRWPRARSRRGSPASSPNASLRSSRRFWGCS